MLRKRSREVTSKQAKVGDQNNNFQWFLSEKHTKPISYFFNSPRIFKGFLPICSPSQPPPPSEVETTTMIPTSSTNTKIVNPTSKNMPQNKHSWDQFTNKKGICLALVDENTEQLQPQPQLQQPQTSNSCLKQKSKLVVFGSHLKIQVPPMPHSSAVPCFSPESPREFGIKTPRSLLRPFGGRDTHQVHAVGEAESILVSEMEDSEDYTCVISHGPNPKTTHIFGNCIVGSCCGIDRSSRRNGCLSPLEDSGSSEESFLSFCHHCKKKLGQGKDMFMYREEKGVCSQECHCQEMFYDDGVKS